MALFNDAGEEVEGALTPDEVAAIKAEAEEHKAKLQEAEERLKGLEAKDFNFRRFEEAKEDEKKKMLEGFTEKEQAAIKREAAMTAKVEQLEGAIFQKDRDIILSQIAGSDAEMKEKIEAAAKRIVGTPSNAEEWRERYVEAAALVNGFKPKLNPLNHYQPVNEYSGRGGSNKFTETDKGKADFKGWFGIDLDKK